MIKYLATHLLFIGLLVFTIFFSCGPKPQVTPAVDEAKLAAEKANKELITETGEYTEVEKDLSSVEAQVTGKLDPPTEELTRLEPQELIAGYWREISFSWKRGTTLSRENLPEI